MPPQAQDKYMLLLLLFRKAYLGERAGATNGHNGHK